MSPVISPCYITTTAVPQVAYFVNSGSEANDLALLMARLYSGNYDLVALRNCYHGLSEATMGMLGHATWKFPVPQARACYNMCLDCYHAVSGYQQQGCDTC